MKERPILMSAPMVRALLAGTKTQTRRVVKPQPTPVDPNACRLPGLYRHGDFAWRDKGAPAGCVTVSCKPHGPDGWAAENSPYGMPGDRLWVRETWADEHPLAIQDGRYSQPGLAGIPGPPPVHYRTIYRADGEPRQIWRNADQSYPYFTASGPARQIDADYPTVCSNYTRDGKGIHWRPSIHMPRWASRILLEVTAVRVERLQDIGEDDARAEGVDALPIETGHATPKTYFQFLWESINGPGSWAANPWVWVIEFKRVTP